MGESKYLKLSRYNTIQYERKPILRVRKPIKRVRKMKMNRMPPQGHRDVKCSFSAGHNIPYELSTFTLTTRDYII